jgi:hypothetical protein
MIRFGHSTVDRMCYRECRHSIIGFLMPSSLDLGLFYQTTTLWALSLQTWCSSCKTKGDKAQPLSRVEHSTHRLCSQPRWLLASGSRTSHRSKPEPVESPISKQDTNGGPVSTTSSTYVHLPPLVDLPSLDIAPSGDHPRGTQKKKGWSIRIRRN